MRVIQLLPTLSFGDAIGNDTIALSGAIAGMGYSSEIYAENIDKRLPSDIAKKFSALKGLKPDDVVLYHKSTGTDLTFKLDSLNCRKIMVYHNITPPEFFRPYSVAATQLTEYGYKGVEHLRGKVDYCLADSSYNKAELVRMGYVCPIDVRPILIRFEDYKQQPDSAVMQKYSGDGWVNIVFVGRIAPNKKQEDLIRAFYHYKRINPKSRLILVGSATGMENYQERLVKYAKALGLEDVIFTGHIKFSEILAYYRLADVFLCMSAHEGFCVPLAEAMFFDIPIIAYSTSAIPDTLGGSGVLLDDNDPVFAARVIDRVVNDAQLREHILEGQRRRLEDFSYERIRDIFENQLRGFIEKK